MAVSLFSQLHPLLHGNNERFHSPSKKEAIRFTFQLKCIGIIQCCSSSSNHSQSIKLRTCKNCKSQFDPSLNHPLACRFHTAHFGGETKRKFESVYEGGTMSTPDSGKVFQYWHCCGSEDPFHPGCTSAPHSSYDD
ncbi:hypothetical protein PIB30_002821 [Stylosanthes scabra]|uniref:Uncharacterized protein n=1 Tax=Stylosanthes scabra TaxID=79078 RepID=A0ABU6T4V5_9FABA|nr:hypothetical protein [Stylosanthes scabra]